MRNHNFPINISNKDLIRLGSEGMLFVVVIATLSLLLAAGAWQTALKWVVVLNIGLLASVTTTLVLQMRRIWINERGHSSCLKDSAPKPSHPDRNGGSS
jgi:hypothetical protein